MVIFMPILGLSFASEVNASQKTKQNKTKNVIYMCHDLHDKNSWKLVQQWHSCREVIPVYLHRSLNFNRYFNTYKNLLGVVQMLHSLHKTTTTTTIKKEKLAVTEIYHCKNGLYVLLSLHC